ncbi:acyltransferase family protein [Ruminococcus sp. 5_1_39BFAA]|uniref:acyltransferase family protein n=1 Tax=Ruminococcus sp. 5_1_39BFAA TaxID=457412 RepID=UPI0035651B51
MSSCGGGGTQSIHLVIQTIQMPLFMFLSGYCAFYSLPILNCKEFIMKKCKFLIVPYLSWVVILWVKGIQTSPDNANIKVLLSSIINSQFWFLRLLFYIFVLLVAKEIITVRLRKRTKYHEFIAFAFTVVMSVIASAFPGCGGLYKHYILFLFGILVHYIDNQKILTAGKERVFALITGTSYVLCVCMMLWGSNQILVRLSDYASAFLGVVSIYYLIKSICIFCVSKSMIFIGKQTLGLYAFHWCVLFSMGYGRFSCILESAMNDMLKAIVLTVIWLVVSVGFVRVISINRYIKAILIG